MPITLNGSGTVTGLSALPDSAMSTGSIIQVVSTTKTDTFSESLTEANFSGAAISLSITPSSNSNKILLFATLTLGLSNDNEVEFAFFKGGSIITGAIGDTASNRTRSHAAGRVNATSSPGFVAGHYLDSPSTTSATTYSVRLSHQNNGSATVYLNRSHSDTDADQDSRMASTLTAMEVVA
tara:strand:+ start:360 stop:902 length:543 start_codon:yes stop_codon:yes gene_type:complete